MIYFSSNHSSVITVLIGITSAMFLKGLISSSMFPRHTAGYSFPRMSLQTYRRNRKENTRG